MMNSLAYIKKLIKERYRIPLAILTDDFPVNTGDEVTTIVLILTAPELVLLKSGKILINSGNALYNYVIVYDPA